MQVKHEELRAFKANELPIDWTDEDIEFLAEFLGHLDLELVQLVKNEEYDYAVQREIT